MSVGEVCRVKWVKAPGKLQPANSASAGPQPRTVRMPMAKTVFWPVPHTRTLTGRFSVDRTNLRLAGVAENHSLLSGAREHGFENVVVGDPEKWAWLRGCRAVAHRLERCGALAVELPS